MADERAERLGAAVAQARAEAGFTQVMAAKRLGVSQSYIAKIETGRRRLTYLEAVAFARAYGVTINDFEPPGDPER